MCCFDAKYLRHAIVLFFIGGLLMSCAAPHWESFKSNDYVLYRLQGGDTPESVAKKFLGDARKAWIIEDANPKVKFSPNKSIIIPLKSENKAGLYEDSYQVVPILCYHRFAKRCKDALCVTEKAFKAQMQYLKKKNYRVISLKELVGFLEYKRALPRNAIVITIDDGYKSVYDIAVPILKKHGFTATLFIYTDFVGASSNSMTWQQLRELKAQGFEIGSHTLSHPDLTLKRKGETDQKYRARVRKEIFESKKIIDREMKQNTQFIAFPYSTYNMQVLNLVKKANYKLGLTVETGENPFFADLLVLRRNQVLGEDIKYFTSRIATTQEMRLK